MARHYLTKELKAKWLKALESGDYKQGTHALYDNMKNTYCCLGVLGEVCNIQGNFDNTFLSDGDYLRAGNSIVFGLPMKVQKRLSEMNDERVPFKKIAAYIRKNIKPVNAPKGVTK